MTMLIILLVIAAAVYGYAAIAFYYGYKSWRPVCGCQATEACNLEDMR